MDKESFCHSVAMETAKMYVNSNLPEYKVTGTEKLAKDLSEKYISAYVVASDVFDEKKKFLKSRGLL